MAVISNTSSIVPSGVEQDVVAISPGAPLDKLTAYFVGGQGSGGLTLSLYATVGSVRTLVAQSKAGGSSVSSIVAWETVNKSGQTSQLNVGGTTYTISIVRTGSVASPAASVTMTLAGVDTFDTAADDNFSSVFPLAPGGSASLPVFSGYAQAMDVAVDQSIPLDVTVSVTADCGASSVAATVNSVKLTGKDDDIAAVFLGLQLPVATRYFVNVTNNAKTSINLTTAGVTSSTSVTAGGVVTLAGDVMGPSSSNTVIKWRGVALDAATFNGPVDAAIPIYDSGATTWRALAMSGGATMTDAGVVTIAPAAVVLAGDVTGAANANTVGKWDGVALDASMATPAIGDTPVFNVDGTWHAIPNPAGGTNIQTFTTSATNVFAAFASLGTVAADVTGFGGGGGGGGGCGGENAPPDTPGPGGGGGGGSLSNTFTVAINMTHQIDVVVGAGGTSGAAGAPGAPGGIFGGGTGGDGGVTYLIDSTTTTVLCAFGGGSGGTGGLNVLSTLSVGQAGVSFPGSSVAANAGFVAAGNVGTLTGISALGGNKNQTAIGSTTLFSGGAGGGSGGNGGCGGGGGAGVAGNGGAGGSSTGADGNPGGSPAANTGAGGGGAAGGGGGTPGGAGGAGGSGLLSVSFPT